MSVSRVPPEATADYVRRCIGHGMLRLKERRLDEATAEFQDALRFNPGSVEARFGLGECLALRGKLDDAVAKYLECLELNPHHLQARFSLGNVYFTKGKINEALRQFLLVHTAEPDNLPAWFNIAKCLEKKNQHKEAVENYGKITQKFPDFIDAYLAAARCYVALGQENDAIAEYRRAIARAPARMSLREMLIQLLERESLFELAIAEHRAILAMRPGDVNIYLNIASVMDRGGMIRDAIDEYARAMKIDPRNSIASVKSKILIRERQKIDSLTDRYLSNVINRMNKIGNDFREGMKLYIDGCYDDAIPFFEREIATAPSPESYFALGACIVRTGRLLHGIPPLREAVKLKADFPEAHTMLGILYERHGLLYESTLEYEKGVKEAQDQVKHETALKGNVDLRATDPHYKFLKLE